MISDFRFSTAIEHEQSASRRYEDIDNDDNDDDDDKRNEILSSNRGAEALFSKIMRSSSVRTEMRESRS